MSFSDPAVVIDVGSNSTRAGFACDDLPRAVYSTSYLALSSGPVFGDDAMAAAALDTDAQVMTITQDALVYDFDALAANWSYAFDHIDTETIDPTHQPLVVTEPAWNTSKHRVKMAQLAFESMSVPLFSLVKTPLAQLYRAGRLTGLVIDVGSASALVTPVLDGIVQTKCAFHLPYAGDFLDAHALASAALSVDQWLPEKYAKCLPLFKLWYTSRNSLLDFKSLVLSRPELRHYVVPDTNVVIPVPNGAAAAFLAPVFSPQIRPLPGLTIPEPQIDKPKTHGLTNMLILALKLLQQQAHSQQAAGSLRFADNFAALLLLLVICGGTALAPGLAERLVAEVRAVSPTYFPNMAYNAYNAAEVASPDMWERPYGAWLGACNLATMLTDGEFGGPDTSLSANIALNNWFVSKAEYEELGEDLVVERFK